MKILFWACPIIFVLIEMFSIIFRDSFAFDNNVTIKGIIVSIIDGIIFIGFQWITIYCLREVNINFSTSKDLMYIIITFYIISLFVYSMLIFDDDIEYPIVGTILYVIIAFVVVFLLVFFVSTIKFEGDLNKMDFEYEKTETINLVSINGSMANSGIGNGNLLYLNLVFDSNYRIYYVQKEEDGNLLINYVNYDDENVKIYENDNEVPRLQIEYYKKELINPENNEVIIDDEYKKYIFYIPVGTYSNNFEGF